MTRKTDPNVETIGPMPLDDLVDVFVEDPNLAAHRATVRAALRHASNDELVHEVIRRNVAAPLLHDAREQGREEGLREAANRYWPELLRGLVIGLAREEGRREVATAIAAMLRNHAVALHWDDDRARGAIEIEADSVDAGHWKPYLKDTTHAT
jgi:hypothetical protein